MTDISLHDVQQRLPDWLVVDGRLEISVRAKNFVESMAFLNDIAEVAEAQNHHPDVELRYNTVRMRVLSHDVGTLTDRDLRFAETADELINRYELKRQPHKVTRTHLVISSPNPTALVPFWCAVLGFKDASDETSYRAVDPSDILSPVTFVERRDGDGDLNPEFSTISLDVQISVEQVDARMQLAYDAGGQLVSDDDAPDMWVLGDPDGNRVRLCTYQERDS